MLLKHVLLLFTLLMTGFAVPLQRLHTLQKKLVQTTMVPDEAVRSALFDVFDDHQYILTTGPKKDRAAHCDQLATRFPVMFADYDAYIHAEGNLNVGAHRTLFINQIVLFMQRVHANRADLIATYGMGVDFWISNIDVKDNDPHHLQRRVIIFTTTDGTGAQIQVVYKPSPQDAAFYFNSADADSFFSLYNPWLGIDLYRMAILKYADGDGSYGYLEFIPKHGADLTDNEYNAYSYSAGAVLAAMVTCGLDDMHIENVMTYKVGVDNVQPVVIDAETSFNPNPLFNLASTIAMKVGGAFNNDANSQGDKNSIILRAAAQARPDPVQFKAGFVAGMTAIGANLVAVQNWIANTVADGSFVRNVPIATPTMKTIPGLFNVHHVTCLQLADGFGQDELNKETTWRYFGMFGDHCNGFTAMLQHDDIPAFYLRMDSPRIFFPDLATQLTLDNLPGGYVPGDLLGQRIGAFGVLTNQDLYGTGNTMKTIASARVATYFQPNTTPTQVIVKEVDDLILTFI